MGSTDTAAQKDMFDKMSPSVSPMPHGVHRRRRRVLVDRNLLMSITASNQGES
jgi:hypothetical protein